MTFWIIVVAVNVVIHGVAVTLLRRPMVSRFELTQGDLSQFPEDQRTRLAAIDREAGQHGFRWFGVMMVTTWVDQPAHPAAIWWNGDLGAWATFESLGRKWNLELCADLEDGSGLSVSRVGVAHAAMPPRSVLITVPRAATIGDLLAALPVGLVELPTVRGWPGPGLEWTRTAGRRAEVLGHWSATGRTSPTADGRGVRFRFVAANVLVVLAGIPVRQIIQAMRNRRSRTALLALRYSGTPAPDAVAAR